MSTAVARLVLLAAIPGSAAVILPFTYDTSPLGAVAEGELWSLAWPFFAAPVAGLVALRQILAGRSARLDWIGAYAMMSVAGASTAWSLYLLASESTPSSRDFRFWTAVAGTAVLLGLGAILVSRVRRSALSALTPVVAPLGPFTANAALCLVMFAGDWQSGAYCALVAVVVYGAALARLLGQMGESGPASVATV